MLDTAAIGRLTPSSRFLGVVSAYPRVVVLTHDNPDPDAIASGWAIKYLLDARTDQTVRLVGGGDIVRAENRHMMRLLGPPLELVDDIVPDRETAVVLVDCGPDATNHLMSDEQVLPVAAIDHHVEELPVRLPYADIRPKLAASATIATTYLREQGVEPSMELATALLYAMRTETRGSGTCYSRLDRVVLPWLTRRADPSVLTEIENAPLPRTYYADLLLAVQNTFLYENAAFCILPQAQGPEIIGEIADLLIRCEGISRVLCGGANGDRALISVRTELHGGDATQLVRETLCGLGRGGGHLRRAGGKLTAPLPASKIPENLQDEIRNRWLAACKIERRRGSRLVARHEIVENL